MTSRQAQSDYAKIAGPAVSKVGKAVKAGRLVKSDCADCGGPSAQAHHHNGYEPEHALDVVWLCRPCHMRRHGKKVKAPWERTGYVLATRGPRDYHEREIWHQYCARTRPKRLFWHIETIWGYFCTDEERAAAVALITRLNADAVLE